MKKLFFFCQVTLFLLFSSNVIANVGEEEPVINLSMKDVSVKDVIWAIEKQSKLVFVYNATDLDKAGKIDVEIKKKTVKEALDICLKNTGFEYVIQQNTVVIKRKGAKTPEISKITIKGKVTDKDDVPLPGVTILLKGTTLGITTDMNGEYSLTIPETETPVLIFSFIGMKKEEIHVAGRTVVNVVLQDKQTTVDEVVVTGIYSRKKESFTGSSQTYKAEDLKMVGNQNLLQSLKTLDPAFNILENNQYGSDPNRCGDKGKNEYCGV